MQASQEKSRLLARYESRKMLAMATKRKDPNEPKKLPSGKYDKSDPKYYPWIGRKGGKRTVKNQSKSYFSDIARIRHQSTDSRSTASGETASDSSTGAGGKTRGRAK